MRGERTAVVADERAVLITPPVGGGCGSTLGASGAGWRLEGWNILVHGVYWRLRTGGVASAGVGGVV